MSRRPANKKLSPGDTVRVLRDIYRYDGEAVEQPRMALAYHYDSEGKVSREVVPYPGGGTLLIKGKILYAKEGATGTILELFRPEGRSMPYVKVIIDGKCLTFRLTSIEKIEGSK